ncbi:hypothetical protein KPH14_011395 [Odynerus spinipes]|uniref:Tc1-like transposase DDE domain-containing protein n=1 Tax=Odynerus spinipes TaxID=1348599 RepID=A0AAD9RV29_9HYME|nr:hypothetical protein KPH14_011395 [Odynerus spinipes]
MNSDKYLKLISEQMTTHAARISGEKFIFQQDNAAVHTAKIVKSFFNTNNIPILKWPARSPDINIIGNCWGDLSRAVYAKGRQFNSVNELKECITQEWEKMEQKRIQKLFKSIPKRIISIIKNSGGSTKY